jgi:hypothetical protein
MQTSQAAQHRREALEDAREGQRTRRCEKVAQKGKTAKIKVSCVMQKTNAPTATQRKEEERRSLFPSKYQ